MACQTTWCASTISPPSHLTSYLCSSLMLLEPHFLQNVPGIWQSHPHLWAFLLAVPFAWNIIPPKFLRPNSLLLPGLCPSVHFMKEKVLQGQPVCITPCSCPEYGKKWIPTLNLLGWPGPSLDCTERFLERSMLSLKGSSPLPSPQSRDPF